MVEQISRIFAEGCEQAVVVGARVEPADPFPDADREQDRGDDPRGEDHGWGVDRGGQAHESAQERDGDEGVDALGAGGDEPTGQREVFGADMPEGFAEGLPERRCVLCSATGLKPGRVPGRVLGPIGECKLRPVNAFENHRRRLGRLRFSQGLLLGNDRGHRTRMVGLEEGLHRLGINRHWLSVGLRGVRPRLGGLVLVLVHHRA